MGFGSFFEVFVLIFDQFFSRFQMILWIIAKLVVFIGFSTNFGTFWGIFDDLHPIFNQFW